MSRKPKVQSDFTQHIAEDLRALAVPIGDLVLDPRNARKHDDANIQAIAASLKAFGQVKPLVVHRDTKIIEAGNGTLLAARKLGWTHVAVVWVQHDAAAARGFAIADNRTAELASWDDSVLAELLDQVADDSPDLYADLLLDSLLQPEPAEEEPAPKTGPEKISTYQVVVECTDAADRRRLVAKLRREGRACRALTWDGAVEMPGEE